MKEVNNARVINNHLVIYSRCYPIWLHNSIINLANRKKEMIKCICINDSNRPTSIPTHKWIKKDQEYHIIFAHFLLPQKQLGVQLAEIILDESCVPFEYFLANRFGIDKDDLEKLVELIYESTEIKTSISELMEQTQVTQNN